MFAKPRTRSCSAVCSSYHLFFANYRCRTTCLRTWPKLRCLLRDGRVFWGGPRGNTRVFGMALAAALAVLVALLPAGLDSNNDPKRLKVTCTNAVSSEQEQKVTAAGSVLVVECPSTWKIYPPHEDEQKVCEDATCKVPVPLTKFLPDLGEGVVEVQNSDSGLTITFKELPKTKQTFHVFCHENNTKKCDVTVILNKSTAGPSDGVHPESPPGESGTTSVQTCKANSSITLKIPEEGSSAQFACESEFVLYPQDANQVYSKDCKTKETLSDMKRTETPAVGTEPSSRSETPKPTAYTLQAYKKPSKKTLCYVCAKKGTAADKLGKPADYCTIYVESDARTQLDLNFTFILALPCILAALQFT